MTRQSGGGILQLGQLHLQLTLGGNGVEGKNVQDQNGAVDHTEIIHGGAAAADVILQVADLDGRQVTVKDHEADIVVTAQLGQLLYFTRANEGARVGGGLLDHTGEGLAARGVQKTFQLVQGLFSFLDGIGSGALVAGDHAHQHRLDGSGIACDAVLSLGYDGIFIF